MSEYIPSNSAELGDYEEWQQALVDNVTRLGDTMNSWGSLLATQVHIRLVSGDQHFGAIPHLKDTEDGIEVTCNIESFEIWHEALNEVPEMSRTDIRDLYLSSAAAWVDMSFVAQAARNERKFGGTEHRIAAIAQTKSLADKLISKSDIEANAEELELVHGIIGAKEVVNHDLESEDIAEINRIRYALGAAMYSLGYSQENIIAITDAFRDGLKTVLDQYELTLLQLLDSIAHESNFAYMESNHEQLKQFAFPLFLFAGTMPMMYN